MKSDNASFLRELRDYPSWGAILLTVFLIAFGLSCWAGVVFVQKKLERIEIKPNQSDFFMNEVRYRQMNDNGTVRNELETPHAVHYPDNDEYVFSSPEVKVADAENQIWKISAANGRSKNNQAVIELSDKVKIEQFSQNGLDKILSIRTDNLAFYPKNKYAETMSPVIIEQMGNVVQAVGAKLDLNTGKLNLVSGVRQYIIN